MIYEWDPKKAKANLRRHRVSFEEAATVFLDPIALTYPDPDHSDEELRESRLAVPEGKGYSFFLTRGGASELDSLACGRQRSGSANNMKKASAKKTNDELRSEYDLSQLKGGFAASIIRTRRRAAILC